jgi:hypothetical protein
MLKTYKETIPEQSITANTFAAKYFWIEIYNAKFPG